MQKLKYFPFGEQFDLRMGTIPFSENNRLIDIDEPHYKHEIQEKRKLLEKDHRYYYRSLPTTELAQWDVLEKILDELAVFYPQYFSLIKQGHNWQWRNHLLDEKASFVFGDITTLPLEPLDWVGRQVQEDLVILSNDDSAALVAGQLCFANGWSLDDKFGQPFLGIHAPAPKMVAPTMQTAQKLMERIQVKKSVWRCSWNFKISDALDMSSQHNKTYNETLKQTAPQLDAENIGDKLYIRIERQTISRLPNSNNILFGIHMYQNSLNAEHMDAVQALNMLNVLRTTPREMLNYKAITPFEKPLLTYLERLATAV